MQLSIDPSDRRPLHEQIATSIRRQLIDGELTAGERLPPASQIAAALEVNVNTVLRALRTLRDEGVLEFRRGRGVTVVRSADGRDAILEQARRLRELAAEHGYSAAELATLLETQ